MKEFKPKPFDTEDLKPNQWKPDPYYIAQVLSDLLSRQYGYPVEMVLTPKKTEDDSGGQPQMGMFC